MMSIKVLYATDYSTVSLNALAYAASLARDRGATLLVTHVLEREQYPVGEAFQEEYGEYGPSEEETQQLESIRPVGFDIPVEYRLVFGTPTKANEAICQLAKDEEAEMIVIGTHGHSALESLMGGSVAERVIKHASCPVVAVKQK
jgi:nucleotide-binding universal stress UspA family protein